MMNRMGLLKEGQRGILSNCHKVGSFGVQSSSSRFFFDSPRSYHRPAWKTKSMRTTQNMRSMNIAKAIARCADAASSTNALSMRCADAASSQSVLSMSFLLNVTCNDNYRTATFDDRYVIDARAVGSDAWYPFSIAPITADQARATVNRLNAGDATTVYRAHLVNVPGAAI